jgi:2-dehydropantoate 2-reductase
VSKDIRSEMWVKLWGNLSFNPISALTTPRWKTSAASR